MTFKQFEKDLNELLKEWQKRLRLQDWEITLKVINDQSEDGQYASCKHCFKYKSAVIRIYELPDTDQGDRTCNTDYEVTLIHELLHLHAAAFDSEIPKHLDDHIEFMIEAVARALVDAKSGK